MASQKVDFQKINSLKAKVYDRVILIERTTAEANEVLKPYNEKIKVLQSEVVDLNRQIEEEQNRTKR